MLRASRTQEKGSCETDRATWRGPNAVITPDQAESAIGRNQATEYDEDMLDQIDLDQRFEEEELAGRAMIQGLRITLACLGALTLRTVIILLTSLARRT